MTTATSTQAHVATVTELYEAFGRGDIPAIIDRLAPDVDWNVRDTPSAGQEAGVPWLAARHGRDDVPGFFAALAQELVFHDFQVRRIVGSGDAVFADILLDVESKRTGRRTVTDEAHLWTFGPDGRVIAHRHDVDTARHIEIAGVGPAANAATVADLYGRFGTGDVQGILDRLAPDATWDVYGVTNAGQNAGVPWMQARRGPAEIGGFFAMLGETMDIDTFVPHDVVAGGNRVVSEITFGATIRATGARVDDEIVHIWTFDGEGRPQSFRHIVDTAKHIAAAGLA